MKCYEVGYNQAEYCAQHECEQLKCTYPKKLIYFFQPGVPNLITARYCDFHTCEFRSCTEGVVSYANNGTRAWSTYCSKHKCCEDNCHLKYFGSNGHHDHKRCELHKCLESSCDKRAVDVFRYCEDHKCNRSSCGLRLIDGTLACNNHRCKARIEPCGRAHEVGSDLCETRTYKWRTHYLNQFHCPYHSSDQCQICKNEVAETKSCYCQHHECTRTSCFNPKEQIKDQGSPYYCQKHSYLCSVAGCPNPRESNSWECSHHKNAPGS
ncbi:uncharacterized protein K441DRAFT_694918 [Cenococcum geophilum 1.58]|uniref:uncharacterized protein n=1 Tax=Cenococcum geophilum 1.58 TaxID=794803 RepID=UPI00358DF318|nr:hypothetical protein K441DRAFT_694918 [Cenococcum geophilum 1.58]